MKMNMTRFRNGNDKETHVIIISLHNLSVAESSDGQFHTPRSNIWILCVCGSLNQVKAGFPYSRIEGGSSGGG